MKLLKEPGYICLSDMVDIRADGVFYLFGITAEPALVVGVDPH